MRLSPVRPRVLLAAATVLIITTAGCSSNSDAGSGSPPTGGQQPAASGSAPSPADLVNVQNFAFTPNALTVTANTPVTWKFDDSTDHTVVADDNSFSSQPLGNGQTYDHTFATAGSVPYHCSIHPFMKGTVTVK